MLSEYIVCVDQALIYIPLVIGALISISLMKIPDLSLESAFTAGAIAAYNFLNFKMNIGHYILLPMVIGANFTG